MALWRGGLWLCGSVDEVGYLGDEVDEVEYGESVNSCCRSFYYSER